MHVATVELLSNNIDVAAWYRLDKIFIFPIKTNTIKMVSVSATLPAKDQMLAYWGS